MIVSHVRIIRVVCTRREKLATTGFSRTHPPRSPHSSHQQPNSTKFDTNSLATLETVANPTKVDTRKSNAAKNHLLKVLVAV